MSRSSGRLPVLVAIEGRAEAALVAGLEMSGSGVRVTRRCADLTELLSAAAAGLGRAALLSAGLPDLDRDAVWQLQSSGVAVVALADPADAEAYRRLTGWGVRQILPEDADPEQVAAAVIAAVDGAAGRRADLHPSGPADRASTDLGPAGSGPAAPVPAGAGLDPGSEQPGAAATGPVGRVITVWGPVGAPGRTTIAITLAAELAAIGRSTLLVDADTYGASLAQSLALLDESAGLAAAVRAANNGLLEPARLAGLAPVVSPGLRVLTGLPRPQRWPELRQSGLVEVLTRARQVAEWTVVDAGFCIEADEELSFDTSAPRRNAATLAALEAADLVIAVGSADPVGLQRLVRGLQELREVLPGASVPVRVLVNRVRASAIGDSPDRRVIEALNRFAGVTEPVLVPDDRAACDAAMLAGRSLTECAPQSPARLALGALAAELAGTDQPGRRAGRWRPMGRASRRP